MVPVFLFPFSKVKYGSKVAVYGAGYCGKQFIKQILTSKYAEIVAWVDINYERILYDEQLKVSAPSTLQNCKYDYVVVAITSKTTALSIKEYLERELSIAAEKIVCEIDSGLIKDEVLFNCYSLILEKPSEEDDAYFKIAPISLCTSRRMDLVIRFLLAKDFRLGLNDPTHTALYYRAVVAPTGGQIKYNRGQFEEKYGFQAFLDKFRETFNSIRCNGFHRDCAIPINCRNGAMIDGMHRVASALALGIDIWGRYFDDTREPYSFSFQWYKERGLGIDDQLRMLRGFADLYPNCGIVVLYGSSIEQWDFLTAQFGKALQIVGYTDLNFSDNYIAFENLIRTIYDDPLGEDPYVETKLHFMMLAPLKIRVILLSNENNIYMNVYETMNEIQEKLNIMLDSMDAQIPLFHCTRSREDFLIMKKVLLSPTNIYHLRCMVTQGYRRELVLKLNEVKTHLRKHGLNPDDFLVVGDAILEIMGLVASSALTLAYTGNLGAKEFPAGLHGINVIEAEGFELNGVNYNWSAITENENNYFMFCGMKVLCIALQKAYYLSRKNEINLERLHFLKLFEEFCLSFDDKRVLQQQINEQLRKRFLS